MFWLKKWLGGLLMPLPFTLTLIVLTLFPWISLFLVGKGGWSWW